MKKKLIKVAFYPMNNKGSSPAPIYIYFILGLFPMRNTLQWIYFENSLPCPTNIFLSHHYLIFASF